ncbi:MAG: 50S ribosomal protein L17 [Candidatus Paceibacterota bacterium]
MRHQKTGKKFSRKTGVRQALLRSLMSNLILREKITTTETKAKETRRLIEKLVTKAKVDTVANRKLITQKLGSPIRVNKLFKEIGPRYIERAGGYTRITKLPKRTSDGSSMAIIEFV